MKAKLFMILLVVLFIVPISGAVNKPRKRPVLLRKHETRKNVLPRIPIDYTITVRKYYFSFHCMNPTSP